MRRRAGSKTDEELGLETPEAKEQAQQKEIHYLDKTYDFDNPNAIDWDLLIKGIDMLLQGKPFNKPFYDDHLKQRMEKTEKIYPDSKVIIVEGHLIFTNEELMKRFNLKVFIDTDDDVRLSRRVLKISYNRF